MYYKAQWEPVDSVFCEVDIMNINPTSRSNLQSVEETYLCLSSQLTVSVFGMSIVSLPRPGSQSEVESS